MPDNVSHPQNTPFENVQHRTEGSEFKDSVMDGPITLSGKPQLAGSTHVPAFGESTPQHLFGESDSRSLAPVNQFAVAPEDKIPANFPLGEGDSIVTIIFEGRPIEIIQRTVKLEPNCACPLCGQILPPMHTEGDLLVEDGYTPQLNSNGECESNSSGQMGSWSEADSSEESF